jgi:TPR repeat protein
MKRQLLSLTAVLALSIGAPVMTRAQTLDLPFLPPKVEPQDLCSPAARAAEEQLEAEGREAELNDKLRIRYISRDILRLQAEDPDRWFDFIMALIDWRALIDIEFAGNDALLAKIKLYVDAGRIEALQQEGLIDQLRNSGSQVTNAQKVALSHYYANGIGVVMDEAIAEGLLLDAAFGGNSDALLNIARRSLQGRPVVGWDAPLDLTVTLALGGMLGQMNSGVCASAERIAREYLRGDVVSRNPDIAMAWYRFAADLGGANAAWRIVEYHLSADADRKDNAEMLKYLRLAVERGVAIQESQVARIKAASDVTEEELTSILGYNYSADDGTNRPQVSRYFQLTVNIDADMPEEEGTYLLYLKELTAIDAAPGWVFTELAKEITVRQGLWAGEPEALPLLEEAANRRDPEGMQLLAKRLLRYRDDPARLNRAINVLEEAVARFGMMSAMQDLDTLFRCQAPDAPRLGEADLWQRNYRASQDRSVTISPTDLMSLDPFKKPEMIAQIQSQALEDRPDALSNYLQRVQMDPWSTDRAYRIWAARTNASDKAMELFAELEFSLATNPAERNLALELFRRVYLNNGVTTALDLAIALVEDNGRDPAVAEEILALLNKSANRGEGASIRLIARLLEGRESGQAIYERYAQAIEDRGDFLALTYAIPYVSSDKIDDYIDRAVSQMNCTTKDTDEVGEVYGKLGLADGSFQWRQIGLAVEGGNSLAKLGVTDQQYALFNTGAAATQIEVEKRGLEAGDPAALRSLFALTADPDLPGYDPEAAAGYLSEMLSRGGSAEEAWVVSYYRKSAPELRRVIEQKIDMAAVYQKAAQAGDLSAKVEYALLLRDQAQSLVDLQESARWLQEAAESGNTAAMVEFGQVLAYGIGVPQDRNQALVWLQQAEEAGDVKARDLARLVRLEIPG